MADSAWGNAVIVRPGTGASAASARGGGGLTVMTVPSASLSRHGGGGEGDNAIPGTPLIPCDRYTLLPPATLVEAVLGRDIADTFWRPDAARGERGLLEALHMRTAANTTFLLVSTRPDAELSRNFSTPDGKLFSLQHNMFKLSKTALAFGQLDSLDDDTTIRGRDVKHGLRQGLPALQQDDYYLVRYRDYSNFAVRQFSEDAKRDSLFGPKFVERYFAVRVGGGSGVFIPISEPQAIFGWELLQRQKLEMAPSAAQNCFALNADQFRSLGVVVPEDPNAPAAAGSPRGGGGGGGGAAGHAPHEPYVPPHPWDWTPSAIQRRWQHFLEQKYRAVGRFVVQALVVGACLYVALAYTRRALGWSGDAHDSAGRSSRRGGGGGGSSSARRVGVVPTLLSGMGLRGVFDLLLAPSSSQGTHQQHYGDYR